jgi:hypothetical protein
VNDEASSLADASMLPKVNGLPRSQRQRAVGNGDRFAGSRHRGAKMTRHVVGPLRVVLVCITKTVHKPVVTRDSVTTRPTSLVMSFKPRPRVETVTTRWKTFTVGL